VRGECVVALVTNRLERLRPGSLLVRAGAGALEVVAARPHQGRFIVSFAGVDDRERAEQLRGTVLLAEPIDDDPETWFVHELIGCQVDDTSGRRLGTVTAVEANPASDLLVLDGRHLVPLRFVVERSRGRLVAEVPAGLLE
jgi:16S rRNA processing protein RimM